MKGNASANYVSWFIFVVSLITIMTPQIISDDSVSAPDFSTDDGFLGIVSFLWGSIVAMLQLSFIEPSIGFVFLSLMSGMMYMLFKDIVPPLVQGMMSNVTIGTALGIAVVLAFAGTFLAIIVSLIF